MHDAGTKYDFAFVDSESFEKYRPKGMKELLGSFRQFKD